MRAALAARCPIAHGPRLIGSSPSPSRPRPPGKAPTFGIKDDRSIKDQRESLPIFKLKDQLVQAVIDNQVGVGHLFVCLCLCMVVFECAHFGWLPLLDLSS